MYSNLAFLPIKVDFFNDFNIIEDFPNISLQNMNFDYFFSWGNFFSNNLKKFNKKTKFINVGNFNFSDNY